MFLVEFEMLFYSFGKAKNFFLFEGQSDHLYTDWHALCVFEVVPDKLSDGVLPFALIVSFVFSGDGDGL